MPTPPSDPDYLEQMPSSPGPCTPGELAAWFASVCPRCLGSGQERTIFGGPTSSLGLVTCTVCDGSGKPTKAQP